MDGLYSALVVDAEQTAQDWDLQGRTADAWKKYGTQMDFFFMIHWVPALKVLGTGYLPHDLDETGGSNTRQVSRSLEVCLISIIGGARPERLCSYSTA